MDLLIIGIGMGMVGGMLLSPLKMIALTQVALGRWGRAIFVLIGPPLVVDGAFLCMTLLFFRIIPQGVAHYLAYVGGAILILFAARSLWELRRKSPEEMAGSATYTFGGVAIAVLAEAAAPGTWFYWLTIAGPILAEGRTHGYMHVVPFFAGGLFGFYGAEVFSTWLISWGAGLHKAFKKHLILVANLLLLVLGISYLLRAHHG